MITTAKTLPFKGGNLNYAGAGRAPGSLAYLDPLTGKIHDVFRGTVTSTGRFYSLAKIAGNSAMGEVRVDRVSLGSNANISTGDLVMVTGLEYLPEGPRARFAWMTPAPAPMRAAALNANKRFNGIVVRVSPTGTFGEILTEKTGQRYWVHVSAFSGGSCLRVGERVSFLLGRNDKGPAAMACCPA